MLPNPDNYRSWQDYARELNRVIEDSGLSNSVVPLDTSGSTGSGGGGTFNGNATSITMPGGYRMAWLSEADAQLFLGNEALDPPVGADLFRIDTVNIANAAITTGLLRDNAVSLAKIIDEAVTEAKLAPASVTTTRIGTAAITTAKIADLAVGSAKIGDASILTAKILDGAIVTAKIADAAIVTALIGDAQIVEAKIADLAVNTAKIANAAITSAKIANLAVGTANMQDGSIVNAKIGNVIQSASWDGTNGWRLNKSGLIEGTAIAIYNPDGSLAFGSGSKINLATQVIGSLAAGSVSGLGTLALLNSITPANTSGFGALATQSAIDLATQVFNSLPAGSVSGLGALAALNSIDVSTQTTGSLPYARTVGFGSLAAISLLNSGNIGTYIAAAAIGQALIANAAIGTAQIDNAAITSALIADAAILNAKIADGTITNAKIANLSFDKMTAGTLDAQINMGTGTIVFTIGGNQLILGKGFGSTNQFFLWYGPVQASFATCTEVNATVYLKTNGSAYFGGALASGVLKNAVQTTALIAGANVTTGAFGSNGGTRSVTVSYNFGYSEVGFGVSCPVSPVTPAATIALYRGTNGSGTLLSTQTFTGWHNCEDPVPSIDPGSQNESISGSFTYSDTSGGTSASYYVVITSRTANTFPQTQSLGILSVET